MSESLIVKYKAQINTELADVDTMKSLLDTTFKGLQAPMAKRALLEGYMRGFTLEHFLKKDVYAIPFKDQYSLVNSIDYVRKIGQKSGIVGKSKPEFEMDGEKIVSCTITVKKKIDDYIGDFTATVYMKEFNTGKQQWASKPHVMISKVAEMHALRMACPEEAQQMYAEEEYQKEAITAEFVENVIDTTEAQKKLMDCKTITELNSAWANLTAQEKQELKPLATEIKEKLTPKIKEPELADDLIEGEVVEEKKETLAAKAMREAKEKTLAQK
jgi:hypothetical protein